MFIHKGIRYRDEDAERLGYKVEAEAKVAAAVEAVGKAVTEAQVHDKARHEPDGTRAVTAPKARRRKAAPDDDLDGKPAAAS